MPREMSSPLRQRRRARGMDQNFGGDNSSNLWRKLPRLPSYGVNAVWQSPWVLMVQVVLTPMTIYLLLRRHQRRVRELRTSGASARRDAVAQRRLILELETRARYDADLQRRRIGQLEAETEERRRKVDMLCSSLDASRQEVVSASVQKLESEASARRDAVAQRRLILELEASARNDADLQRRRVGQLEAEAEERERNVATLSARLEASRHEFVSTRVQKLESEASARRDLEVQRRRVGQLEAENEQLKAERAWLNTELRKKDRSAAEAEAATAPRAAPSSRSRAVQGQPKATNLARGRLETLKEEEHHEALGPEDFEIHYELGSGAFARVALATRKVTGQQVAIKAVRKKPLKETNSEHLLDREIAVQRSLSHGNILKMFDSFENDKFKFLVLELAPGGNLLKELLKGRFTEAEAARCVVELTEALSHCHARGVIHRDLKPENVLISADGMLKLSDFGCSVEAGTGRRSTFCGTDDYMAPEMVQNYESVVTTHDYAIDTWALGVMVFEFLVGMPPFRAMDWRVTYGRIMRADVEWPGDTEIGFGAKAFVAQLLKVDPRERLPLGKITSHPWVRRAGGLSECEASAIKAEKGAWDTSKTSVEPDTSPAGKEILFKVNDEAGNLHWFKASASNFDSVHKAAGKATSIPSDDILLKFEDGDGDKIALTGDALLHDAVNFARGKSRAVRLFASAKLESTLTRQMSGVDAVPMPIVVGIGLGVAAGVTLLGTLIARRK